MLTSTRATTVGNPPMSSDRVLRSGTLLPAHLAEALRHLADDDLARLLKAAQAEAERRGHSPTAATQPAPPPEPTPPAIAGVTSGQANAVRAAIKAGIKPAVIARQFGVPLTAVRQVMAKGRK